MTSSADLEKWSFSNPVGSYQYYIHGPGAVDEYVNLASSFKNPADTSSKQGVKITIDETAKWNGQTMLRTELIPQTAVAINKGKLYYHFSIKTSAENAPITTNEHQVAFFESHFTELKYGGSANNNLQWHVGGVSKWDVELVADEWHNVAYEIDFDAGAVTFWHSTGNSPLTKTAGPFDASTSSNGADWHLGVLRLPGNSDGPGAEDWFFSGVYIESGELTTAVSGPGGGAGDEEPVTPAPAVTSSTAVAAAPSTSVSVAAPAASSVEEVAATPAVPVTSATSTSAAGPIVASSTAAAEEATPIASSNPGPVEVPDAATPSSTSSSALSAPTLPTGSGSGSGSSGSLPEQFTIKQFIAWLKAKQAVMQ